MRILIASVLLAAAGSSAADELVLAPEKFSHCVTCHGVELAGNRSVDSPNLSVLQPWYVERQLAAFAAKLRGHAGDVYGTEMQPMAAALGAGDLAAAVEFVALVPPRPAAPTISGDAEAGETLYATCAACHGANGEGVQSLDAPPLAGQSDWYLLRQLQNYRSGARGAAAGDIPGAQMSAAMSVLAGTDDLRNVLAYINTLSQR